MNKQRFFGDYFDARSFGRKSDPVVMRPALQQIPVGCGDIPVHDGSAGVSHLAVREKQSRRPGGYGLLLANKLVDDVIYGEHGNDVILIKYLDPAVPTTA